MAEFVLWYCRYDPDTYFGHRKVRLKAPTMDQAKIEAQELINRASTKGPFEVIIHEVVHQHGPSVYYKE